MHVEWLITRGRGFKSLPATSFRSSGPFPVVERALCVSDAVVSYVVKRASRAAWQRDGKTRWHGMRQPGRGGRCRLGSLGASPRDTAGAVGKPAPPDQGSVPVQRVRGEMIRDSRPWCPLGGRRVRADTAIKPVKQRPGSTQA